ncbi:hypothetical protein [Streptomyces sp. AM 2-1-1]|uniref:hypothetical protein n=1 Tax=Streptomyces sp. AM 2-1-1 TaxID=3028709 RepID=UPI0023B91276|nr:hypothetical protein [Streptomyces sp. AM 2-1-1]WEH38103.1 hypothetical protein PZB77_00445 [Streptomyces sp. AM 2-1-1]
MTAPWIAAAKARTTPSSWYACAAEGELRLAVRLPEARSKGSQTLAAWASRTRGGAHRHGVPHIVRSAEVQVSFVPGRRSVSVQVPALFFTRSRQYPARVARVPSLFSAKDTVVPLESYCTDT